MKSRLVGGYRSVRTMLGRALRDGDAVDEELDRPGGQATGVDRVASVEGVELESVVRNFRVRDRNRRGQSARLHNVSVSLDVDSVVAVGGVDDDAVGLAVAAAAAEGAGEVDADIADVGSAQVVDGGEVGAAEGVEVDSLDAGGVHRDRALGAEEAEALAVRGQVDLLAAAGAVEAHRVGAVLAFDDVAAVAGIPDERVIAGAHEPRVGAAVSVDRVVAVATDQALGSGASSQGVAS